MSAMEFVGVREVKNRNKGMHGYAESLDIDGYGVIAYGGEQQRGTVFVSINGSGCQQIADFSALRDWAEALHGRITRLDIAADDHVGRCFDIPACIDAYRNNAFNNGGRRPKPLLMDDLGCGDGSTFYVGNREAGKALRVYEKGKHLGDPASPWIRAEVEFHGKDRVIPWDAVTQPVPYLAGAYPFFSDLSLIPERMKTIKLGTQISLEAARRWARQAAGPTVNVLLEQADGDIGAVIDAIRRRGVPKRLRSWLDAHARLVGVAESGHGQ